MGSSASATSGSRTIVADLGPDEFGRGLVRLLADEQVGEGSQRSRGRPGSSASRSSRRALGIGHLQRSIVAALDRCTKPDARFAGLAPEFGVALLHPLLVFGIERRVAGRHAEVRRALEDGEMRGLLRDDRDGLDRRTTRCRSTPTRCPVKSTPSCGHLPVWYDLPAKRLAALEVGHLRVGQAARGHDAEAREDAIAAVGLHDPSVARSSKCAAIDARIELDVASAGRTGRPRGWRSAGSPAGRHSARSSATPAAARPRTSRSSPCSRRRSARPDSGSSTRCRRRRCPPRRRAR